MQKDTIEKTGHVFSTEKMLLARQKTWDAIDALQNKLVVGMLESEATQLMETILGSMGVIQKWHRSWIRFGKNTLLPYGVLSEPGTKLQENDICFLDIGPIFDGFEGDCGTTCVLGNDPEMRRCAEDVKKIFDATKERWKTGGLSGEALYAFAQNTAKHMGWILNLKGASGHRLCDFPHALHHKGPITELDFSPSEYLWVLEIQIRHPERPFGAFYEDLLVND